MKNLIVASAFLLAAPLFAGEQLLNLPPAPKGGRFAVPKDRTWPANPGEADICLWHDDRFAACCITIDDNCKPDHDWWLKLTDELGIKVTWFVITDGVKKKSNPGFAGTWADFQKLADAGHSIQSHTTNHKSKKKGEPDLTEEELTVMYRDSLADINANITNNLATCIAYPCGEAHTEVVSKYAIAARGVYGVPSQANAIAYLNTNKGAGGKGHVEMVAFGETQEGPKWVAAMKNLKRGLNIVLYHFVHAGRTEADKAKNAAAAESEVRYMASLKDDRLWMGRFDDVMKYGQERDSATLTVTDSGADKIAFVLSDRMKDDLFNFPLTVKVHLPAGWKGAKAAQGGKSVPVRVVEHEGASYALVQAVPDCGKVVVEAR